MKKTMQEWIAKGKDIYIGLEDSKRSWKLCVRHDRIVIHETSMEAKYSVLESYLRNRFPDCTITVMYEAGFKGFTLRDKLVKDGIRCIVTPPHTVTEEKANRVKCDKLDARRLAKNLENRDFRECCVPEKGRRDDRQISRTLIQIQKNITTCKNRIRKFIDFNGYDEEFPAGAWYDKDYLQLDSYMTVMPEPLADSLRYYLDELDFLTSRKKAFQDKLKNLYRGSAYTKAAELIASMPGIGWFTAIRLILELGTDFSRFPSGKHIASFFGLTGRERSSGETVHRGRLTKLGSRMLRAMIIECAWTAYKRDPVLSRQFQEIYRRTSSKKKAIVAVARKMVVRMRAMMLSGQPYEIGLLS